MNFSKADRVREVIVQMKLVEVNRARNRALIDNMMNGFPPYTEQEAKENNIQVNVNWKEGTNALHAARGQYENAFLKPGNFFKISIDNAPVDKQSEWNNIVTKELNTALKKSRSYIQVQRSKFAGVCLHGVGIQMWEDDENPIPYFVGMQDVLISTDVDLTLDNMQFFAVRRKMRPGQLFKKTIAKKDNVDRGWNLPFVKKILDNLKDENLGSNNTRNWTDHPEQMAELYKQNASYYDSDKAPEISMWDFYYREEGDEEGVEAGWYRDIILDEDCNDARSPSDDNPLKFVYRGTRPVSPELDQFIHFQFGDGNNVPPFKYHSIRSLGWLLFDVVQLMNRTRCQFTQHVFESMLTLFRVTDAADRARITKVMLFDKGIIESGVQIVPASERFNVEPALVNNLMAGLKQIINESSSSYTSQIDNGSQKERTKFEVEAIMSQISSLMSTMLNLAYIQEYFAYIEICRRFTKNPTSDFMVKKFRSSCIAKGVASDCLRFEKWSITVEQVLGGGNKMLEIAQARELRSMRPTLDPESQREVDRMYVTALTDNARLAENLIPEGAKVTDAIHDAELAFGSLMQGVQMSVREGLNHHEQVTTLLRLMGQRIKQINDAGGVGTQADVIGLNNVAQYIQKHIEIIAQDLDEKGQVKEYGDILSNFSNFVRAFQQRQQAEEQKKAQEAQQAPMKRPTESLNYADAPEDIKRQIEAQAGLTPSQMPPATDPNIIKLQSEQAKMEMERQSHEQNQTMEQAGFRAEQTRKDAALANDIARKNAMAEANAIAASKKTAAAQGE